MKRVDLSSGQKALAAAGHRHTPVELSRRSFLRNAIGGSSLLLAGGILRPLAAFAANPNPKPINGGIVAPYHFYPPDYKEGGPAGVYDQSTITDFDGVFASTDITGWGKDQTGKELYFRCDMRFMEGSYLDVDGAQRIGSFGFI